MINYSGAAEYLRKSAQGVRLRSGLTENRKARRKAGASLVRLVTTRMKSKLPILLTMVALFGEDPGAVVNQRWIVHSSFQDFSGGTLGAGRWACPVKDTSSSR